MKCGLWRLYRRPLMLLGRRIVVSRRIVFGSGFPVSGHIIIKRLFRAGLKRTLHKDLSAVI